MSGGSEAPPNPTSPTLVLRSGGFSHVGKVREINEDAFAVDVDGAEHLLMVCDGMGGHAAGEVASALAIQALRTVLRRSRGTAGTTRLAQALAAAHQAVIDEAASHAEHRGMGTTAAIAIVSGETAYFGNVGDSRVLLVRGPRVAQLSTDHTRAARLLQNQIITEAEFKNHPERGTLTQALGQRVEIEPALDYTRLLAGDRLILCTDGVYESLLNEDLAALTRPEDAYACAQRLVEMAVLRDGGDNATAVVLVVSAADGHSSGTPGALDTSESPALDTRTSRGRSASDGDSGADRPAMARRPTPWAALAGAAVVAFGAGALVGNAWNSSPAPGTDVSEAGVGSVAKTGGKPQPRSANGPGTDATRLPAADAGENAQRVDAAASRPREPLSGPDQGKLPLERLVDVKPVTTPRSDRGNPNKAPATPGSAAAAPAKGSAPATAAASAPGSSSVAAPAKADPVLGAKEAATGAATPRGTAEGKTEGTAEGTGPTRTSAPAAGVGSAAKSPP